LPIGAPLNASGTKASIAVRLSALLITVPANATSNHATRPHPYGCRCASYLGPQSSPWKSADAFSVDAWFALIGPKKMSGATVKKLHEAVVVAFKDPAVMDAMARQGNTIDVSTPEQAQPAFRTELAKYAALVKKVGLQPQ
jgi:Tripartite tricarboxylate transporter family receptor